MFFYVSLYHENNRSTLSPIIPVHLASFYKIGSALSEVTDRGFGNLDLTKLDKKSMALLYVKKSPDSRYSEVCLFLGQSVENILHNYEI